MKAFSALAEPTRLEIVEMLAKGELSSGEISAHFHVSSPAVSQHLKILRAARLVRVRAEAQRRIYALDPAGLAVLDEWLVRIRKFWTDRLRGGERPAAGVSAEAPAAPGRAPETSRPGGRPSPDRLPVPSPGPP